MANYFINLNIENHSLSSLHHKEMI